MTIYVGLDLATVAGFAVIDNVTKTVLCDEVVGKPPDQFTYVQGVIDSLTPGSQPIKWAAEEAVTFLNAKTTRDLIGRIGYFKWTLAGMGVRLEMMRPTSVRHALGLGSKTQVLSSLKAISNIHTLTDNHADAIAVAMYYILKDTGSIDMSQFSYELLSEEEE